VSPGERHSLIAGFCDGRNGLKPYLFGAIDEYAVIIPIEGPLPLLRFLWERRCGLFRGGPMRAAMFRKGEIVVDEVAEPAPGAGQVR
jgi:hypothetical protein